jgi:hypothetical protein
VAVQVMLVPSNSGLGRLGFKVIDTEGGRVAAAAATVSKLSIRKSRTTKLAILHKTNFCIYVKFLPEFLNEVRRTADPGKLDHYTSVECASHKEKSDEGQLGNWTEQRLRNWF